MGPPPPTRDSVFVFGRTNYRKSLVQRVHVGVSTHPLPSPFLPSTVINEALAALMTHSEVLGDRYFGISVLLKAKI